MPWVEYKPGDLVQLKSGGAPMTCEGPAHFLSHKFRCRSMSPGGLMQVADIPGDALKRYFDQPTPHVRKADAY